MSFTLDVENEKKSSEKEKDELNDCFRYVITKDESQKDKLRYLAKENGFKGNFGEKEEGKAPSET